MKIKASITVWFMAAIFFVAFTFNAQAEIQIPKTSTISADKKTLDKIKDFYDQIESALANEDIDKLMSFYAKDYLHCGITRNQLRFMWLEIFNTYSGLYSIHAFKRIHVNGKDAILGCTGALMGIKKVGEEYTAVDRWADTNHWITKVAGKWRIVGGATHKGPTFKGTENRHPLF